MNNYLINFSCGKILNSGYCGQEWKIKDNRCKLPKELCYGCKGKVYSSPVYIKLREEIKLLRELDAFYTDNA